VRINRQTDSSENRTIATAGGLGNKTALDAYILIELRFYAPLDTE